MTVRIPAILLALAFLAASSNLSFGQTFWQAGTADWFAAANWTLGVPVHPADAVIANGGTAQILAPGASVHRLRVGRSEGPGSLLVDGGTLNVTDDLHLAESITNGAAMWVQGGATVNAVDTVVQFSSDDNCFLQITGAGTAYNATTSFIVGRAGNGLATLSVDSGAVLASGSSTISSNGGFGTATVTGAGSRWSSTGAFTVGSVGTGTLNILNQGVVHVGTALSVNGTSTINLNGGTLRFATISGITRVNYMAGTLQLAGNRDIILDAGLFDFYGASRLIPVGKGLTIEGTTTIRQSKSLTVSGGSFTSQGVLTLGAPGLGDGKLFINSGGTVASGADVNIDAFGVASLTGAGSSWTVASNLQVSPTGGRGDLLISTGGSLYIGNSLSLGSSGFLTLNGGTIRFDGFSRNVGGFVAFSAGAVQLAGNRTIGSDAAIQDFFGAALNIPAGKALVVEGTATLTPSTPVTLSGGMLSANTMLMTPGSRLSNTATAQVPGAMLALAGSVIDATGADLMVGDATKVNGFYGAGTLDAGQRIVTLADANDAVLDSAALVTLGAGGSPGTLAAANGLTLNFGGNVTGFGTIDTPNDVFKPLINNGHFSGDSGAEPLTLSGYVKGVGTFDNVNFTGTFTPGFSPTLTTVGSITLTPTSTLIMELGGTSRGGQYDALLASGNLGLGGVINVTLIDAFTLSAGHTFDLFDWATVSGTFATINLPPLAVGLAWDTSQLYSTGALSVATPGFQEADFDEDGDVDGNDLTRWRSNFGTGTTHTQGDADADGDADGNDFLVWQRQLGSGATEIASAGAVPEPDTLALVWLAGQGLSLAGIRRR